MIQGKVLFQSMKFTIPERGPGFSKMRLKEHQKHAWSSISETWAPYPFPQLTFQMAQCWMRDYPMVINSKSGERTIEDCPSKVWWPIAAEGTNEPAMAGWMRGLINTMKLSICMQQPRQAYNLRWFGSKTGCIGESQEAEDEAR